MHLFRFRYFIIVVLFFVGFVSSTENNNNDLILTVSQKETLDKFRELMEKDLPHDYMKTDIYLIRWLRARKFKIDAARTMLLENLRFRRENNMDSILTEDWSDFQRDYRFSLEGCDRAGRPIVSAFVGDWDIRRAIVSGQGQRLMRYWDKYNEEMSTLIRQMQSEGQNVTQWVEIFDLSNYNLVQHSCPSCFPALFYFFNSYEAHFPASTYKSTVINAPAIFASVWRILEPLLSEETRVTISLYGKNREEWKRALLEEIDQSQLTPELEGVKKEPIDLKALRQRNLKNFKCSQ